MISLTESFFNYRFCFDKENIKQVNERVSNLLLIYSVISKAISTDNLLFTMVFWSQNE